MMKYTWLLVCGGLSWLSLANELPSEDQVEKVVVIGDASPQGEQWQQNVEQFEQSYSSDVISQRELQENSPSDIKDALRGVANVRVKDQGSFYKEVSIRGLTGERVLYVVDGVKISSQGMNHGGGGEGNLNDINQTASIEVIKGSPAVIYDPGASGGIVNIKSIQADVDNHLRGGVKAGYDQGYIKDSQHGFVSMAYQGLGLQLSASESESKGYRVADQQRIDTVLYNSNWVMERQGDDLIEDLGYDDSAASAALFLDLDQAGRFDVNYQQYQANDITFTHGSNTSMVFRTDELERKSYGLSYRLPAVGGVEDILFSYNRSEMYSRTNRNEIELQSDTFNLRAQTQFWQANHQFGIEWINDQADNKVSAEQDYYAVFWASDWQWQDWSLSAGVRWNEWVVNKTFRKGENQQLRCQLEGVIGCLPEQTDSALTYSLGLVHSLTNHQNLSFNYAKTHRQPSVYERIAFDNFRGCFDECEAEYADNYELAWRYLQDDLFLSAAYFYNDFGSYINTKEVRKVKNLAALELCIKLGKCNPLKGDYNGMEGDFFSSHVEFYSTQDVVNQGAELVADYRWNSYLNTRAQVSYNEFSSDDPFVGHQSNPIELATEVIYRNHDSEFMPWIKLRTRWVTDTPKVEQYEGFSAFDIYHLYFGFEYQLAKFSFGVRNLTDEVYHEAYSSLDGLGRSYFAHVTFSYP